MSLSGVDVTKAQIDALYEYLLGSDVTAADTVRLTLHAGGNLSVAVVDPGGTVVDDVEFDRSGEA